MFWGVLSKYRESLHFCCASVEMTGMEVRNAKAPPCDDPVFPNEDQSER
jgi:hypothetical protein